MLCIRRGGRGDSAKRGTGRESGGVRGRPGPRCAIGDRTENRGGRDEGQFHRVGRQTLAALSQPLQRQNC